MKSIFIASTILAFATVIAQCGAKPKVEIKGERPMKYTVTKSDIQWREILTPEQYSVMREGATERPFTGKYNDTYADGVYRCPGCGTELFASKTKYDHGTGWPSFTAPIDDTRIEYLTDRSHGMVRTEVRCAACGAHLGHVFDDGPAPTGKHYCINSASLAFTPGSKETPASIAALRKATFAAGCFWGVELKFGKIAGVRRTTVGYIGGSTKNPTYEQVCSGATGHAEAVEVEYDPALTSYERLLEAYFIMHNPTTLNRQGPDIGEQYRSAVFYHTEEQKMAAEAMIQKLTADKRYRDPIVTEVVPAGPFYRAEEYHQKYLEKRNRNTCGF